ncbi:endoribonuclease L-PSP [Syntrophobotulus glycolicus DSM 8271]|uniref:Endoribonuclease L-PSP n=1 Tax=Syntrophobotulus glycolicus (strain DSM 8271 / FlGlyR) TaxID=645991 RepID=F0SUT8_SYNGF|nr:RidA family protein [Syntrophobotulus glycolicus]ADY56654.1 endoribonuclease L-PSP [Syntrophobotulus glycolicus DSM 8271]
MMRQEVKTIQAPAAIGPYSQGIIAGNLVFASGQVPLNPKTGVIESNEIKDQTYQVLDNLKNVLEAAGSGLRHAVKTTIFMKNLSHFAVVNEIYAEFFTEPFPARSCVEVADLPKGALVEIEAIALKVED